VLLPKEWLPLRRKTERRPTFGRNPGRIQRDAYLGCASARVRLHNGWPPILRGSSGSRPAESRYPPGNHPCSRFPGPRKDRRQEARSRQSIGAFSRGAAIHDCFSAARCSAWPPSLPDRLPPFPAAPVIWLRTSASSQTVQGGI